MFTTVFMLSMAFIMFIATFLFLGEHLNQRFLFVFVFFISKVENIGLIEQLIELPIDNRLSVWKSIRRFDKAFIFIDYFGILCFAID